MPGLLARHLVSWQHRSLLASIPSLSSNNHGRGQQKLLPWDSVTQTRKLAIFKVERFSDFRLHGYYTQASHKLSMAKNVTNYAEIQHDEIEALRSIYMEDFLEQEARPGAWNVGFSMQTSHNPDMQVV